MSDELWDFVIVGQGLAGTTLAWHLIEAGQRVLLLDAEEPVTSSKIAAGLITPISGQRLALTPGISDHFPIARDFYRRIEIRTGQSFYHDRTSVRVFLSEEDRRIFEERRYFAAYKPHIVEPQPVTLLDHAFNTFKYGGFQMHSAQLDVAVYLAASRQALPYERMSIDWQRGVTLRSDTISVGHYRSRHLISCEGFAASRNPYFEWVPFSAAKGEILAVRLEARLPPVPLHRGIWLAPTQDADVFRVGSTYDRNTLDQKPTELGRHDILSQLYVLVNDRYEVLDHQAAVRPIIRESHARIGRHPVHTRLGFFNGLGSKGALNAPWLAKLFTDHLVLGQQVPSQFDIQKFAKHAARH